MKHNTFHDIDEAKWIWQTRHKIISVSERALLEPLKKEWKDRVLEVGCGDGGNLFHLQGNASVIFGIDPSMNRLRFAKARIQKVQLVCAVGEALPFREKTFQRVLVRDVLHHVEDRNATLAEVGRVLRDQGRAYVVEPNGRNPIMGMWAFVALFDRRILKNSRDKLLKLFRENHWKDEAVYAFQPFPISRILFHPHLGFPKLETFLGLPVQWLESIVGILFPKTWWGYLGFWLKKTPNSNDTQPAMKESPPNGVMAPNHFTPEKLKR